jgi:hypothetical protein
MQEEPYDRCVVWLFGFISPKSLLTPFSGSGIGSPMKIKDLIMIIKTGGTLFQFITLVNITVRLIALKPIFSYRRKAPVGF